MQNRAIELTPHATELLQANSVLFGLPILQDQDIAALKRRIAARIFDDIGLSFPRVIRVLAKNEPSEEVARLLAEVLKDPSSSEVARRRAAQGLGEIDCDLSRRALHCAIASAEDPLLIAILRALANVGDEGSYRALDRLRAGRSCHILDESTFTRALIAHRIGALGDETELERIAPKPRQVPLRTENRRTLGKVLRRLSGPRYGLDFSETKGISFLCANERHYVLLDKALTRRWMPRKALKRPRIVGAVLVDRGASDPIAVRQLIFSQPTDGDVCLSITTPQGAILFLGRARLTDDAVHLELREHTGSRFQTAVRGSITSKSFALEAEIIEGQPRRKRHGEQERFSNGFV